MKFTVVAVGKLKERFWVDACAEYLKRLQPYAKTQVREMCIRDRYTSYDSGASAGMPDAGSFLSSSFNQAVKTAHEAIQAESSGSGSGGGFSSGGGGGFGGGGGGAR